MTDNFNPTPCCPPFNKERWDNKTLVWQDKLFLKSSVRQIFHLPLGYGKAITRMWDKLKTAGADPNLDEFIMLAYDVSPWKSELYMSATKDIPDEEMARLSGTFLTKVFDGPYSLVPQWMKDMEGQVSGQGLTPKKHLFYFTTCPKCAKRYGHNYVVDFVQV